MKRKLDTIKKHTNLPRLQDILYCTDCCLPFSTSAKFLVGENVTPEPGTVDGSHYCNLKVVCSSQVTNPQKEKKKKEKKRHLF